MALITDENPDPTTLCEGNWYTFGCLDSIWYYRAYCRELRESEQGGYATKLAERLAGIRINKVEAGKTKRGAIRYMWVVWCEAGRFESKVHVLTCLSAKDAHEAAATIIEQRNAQAQARMEATRQAILRGNTAGFSDIEVIGAFLHYGHPVEGHPTAVSVE